MMNWKMYIDKFDIANTRYIFVCICLKVQRIIFDHFFGDNGNEISLDSLSKTILISLVYETIKISALLTVNALVEIVITLPFSDGNESWDFHQ